MRHTRSGRRGSAAVIALLLLPLILLAGMVAVSAGRLRQIETELNATVDLSALAAARALAADSQLSPMPDAEALITDATTAYLPVFVRNSVVGKTLAVDPGTAATVEFGTFGPTGFTPYVTGTSAPSWGLDAVRVTGAFDALRTVRGTAVAVVDRHVYGFTPLYRQNLPLVPFAIDAADWFAQTALNPGAPVTVHIRGTTPTAENASVLAIGLPSPSEFNTQVTAGITAAQLDAAGLSRGIVFGLGNQIAVPGDRTLAGWDPSAGLNDLTASGAVRVWPLASGTVPGVVTVTGFVAARVLNVILIGDSFEVTLAPAVFTTPTAVTTPPPGVDIVLPNPYLGRVRLAE